MHILNPFVNSPDTINVMHFYTTKDAIYFFVYLFEFNSYINYKTLLNPFTFHMSILPIL